MAFSLSTPFIHHFSTLRHGTNPFPFPHATSTPKSRCFKPFSAKYSLDNIPKQFREENLKDGLMENFKNVPQSLYGLSPSQMNMFMSANNAVHQMSQSVTEESITAMSSYLRHSRMDILSSIVNGSSTTSSMGGGGGGRRERGRSSPPDLPSCLLDNRICYLGMPIGPAVAELIVAELMWLDYVDSTEPVHLYINCSGTQNEQNETVGSETDAYAIVDTLNYIKPDIYTLNLSMALGQAAMLLSIGKKGYRTVMPHSISKVYLPNVHKSSGSVTDMWLMAKELNADAEHYIELLAIGTGKPKEEIAKDVQGTRFLRAQEAIDYGLADRIMKAGEVAKDQKDYNEKLARRAFLRGGGNTQAAPSEL